MTLDHGSKAMLKRWSMRSVLDVERRLCPGRTPIQLRAMYKKLNQDKPVLYSQNE